MKKAILFLATFAIFGILFSACKKEDDGPSVTQRIQSKWIFEKTYSHEVYTGNEYRDTTIGVTGDYIDFRTDNKVYTSIGPNRDTINYSILNDTQMIIDGDSTTIQVINDNQFQVYGKSGAYPSSYYEYTIYMKK